MTDIKSAEERSKNMSAIRGKDTKPEVYIRKLLFSKGYRYRKNVSNVEGHPDIYLARYKTAVFVNGCFWHRHKDCRYAYMPKSRVEFWQNKFQKNMERDLAVRQKLSEHGIRQLIIWECTVKKMMKAEAYREEMLTVIEQFLHSEDNQLEL